MSLRPYQERLVAGVRDAWAQGARSVVMQLGTGGGKTHTAAHVLAQESGPVVFAAHLDSLVSDTATRLRAAGLQVGVVAPWSRAEPQHRIQVCSLGTMHARGARPPGELVVLDECHRSEASTVRAILASYPGARLLGLTATPQRGDGQPLGVTWQAMVQGPTVRELTAMGALVPARLVVPEPTASGQGDALRVLGLPGSERVLYFAEGLSHMRAVAERLTAAGYVVGEMHGGTPRATREALRMRLRDGSLHVLLNVGVAVEGWDEPTVDAVVLDAPFGTLGRYLQAVGRGLRASQGKRSCAVYDLRGAAWLHLPPDVPHVWSLTGDAVRQSVRGLALQRCGICWAVYERATACPRCGATRAQREWTPPAVAREARMVELDAIPVERRREAYRQRLVRIGIERRRMTPARAEAWARQEVERKWPS